MSEFFAICSPSGAVSYLVDAKRKGNIPLSAGSSSAAASLSASGMRSSMLSLLFGKVTYPFFLREKRWASLALMVLKGMVPSYGVMFGESVMVWEQKGCAIMVRLVRVVYVWVANLSILFTFVVTNLSFLRSGSTSENLLVPETMHSALFIYILNRKRP